MCLLVSCLEYNFICCHTSQVKLGFKGRLLPITWGFPHFSQIYRNNLHTVLNTTVLFAVSLPNPKINVIVVSWKYAVFISGSWRYIGYWFYNTKTMSYHLYFLRKFLVLYFRRNLVMATHRGYRVHTEKHLLPWKL